MKRIINQYQAAQKMLLAVLALVLVSVQSGTPVVMAAGFIPTILMNKTMIEQTDDKVVAAPVVRPPTIKTIRMDSTAYTSRVGECDGSPFITADGSVVRDGYVATNVLPIGTKIRIPTIFGDKIFEVHDRMNARYSYRVDIWVADYDTAIKYGYKRNIPIEVIEMGTGEKNWDQWKGRTAEYQQVGKFGPAAEPLEQPYLIAKLDDNG